MDWCSRFAGRGLCLLAVAACFATADSARGDRFVYRDRDGSRITVEARLAGSGQGLHALELADGSMRLVPQRALVKREAAPGPEPIDTDGMVELLTERFGRERFRAYDKDPYVIGLVLSAPLPKVHEGRVRGFLRRAAEYMRSIESMFLGFARDVRFPTEPLRYPLVLLIFESDSDFEQYTREAVGRGGVSAGNIAGFYSAVTNHLAVRLAECATFEVPLHEAIHQQVYNRGVLKRLAPVPAWFNEGIATGFQGNGDRASVGPGRLNSRYAEMIPQADKIDWSTLVADDRVFQTDVLAGEAYAHAWSLHWLLVTEHKVAYTNYVKLLWQKETLGTYPAEARQRDFQELFGKSTEELRQQFRRAFEVAKKRQRRPRKREPPEGVSITRDDLAEVRLKAVRRLDLGGVLFVRGSLKNVSPIRDMAFYVTVETTAGMYTGWHVPRLSVGRAAPLKLQRVDRLMKNGPGGSSKTFLVRIRSAPPNSDEAQRWKDGDLPVPVFRGLQE